MTKIDNNNGFELSVISNDETKKLRARRLMRKVPKQRDGYGFMYGGGWKFEGWEVTLWDIDGRKRYSWRNTAGVTSTAYYKTKKDVLAVIATIFNGIFSEAASELNNKTKK